MRIAAVAAAWTLALGAWADLGPWHSRAFASPVSVAWTWPGGERGSMTLGGQGGVFTPAAPGTAVVVRCEGADASGQDAWESSWGVTNRGMRFEAGLPRESGTYWVAQRVGRIDRRIVAAFAVAGGRDREADARSFPPVTRHDSEKIRRYRSAYEPPAWQAFAPRWADAFPMSHGVRVADFCSHDGDRCLVVDPDVLDLFARIATELEGWGIPAHALRPISGYRSHDHNRSEGGAARSRHRYGDAIDFIVDADADGRMDDLDGDGDTDGNDLWRVALLVEDLQAGNASWRGGCGLYLSDTTIGSVHIDTRGHRARWGTGALDARWDRLARERGITDE
ncbi:MAG: hypothetical protein HY608_00030 [Planctomycetes bacterium]|nr:hypothetical protein [Planctomycetota bacterium]